MSARKVAQAIRHAPGLRRLDFVWTLLRRPYKRLLKVLARGGGIAVTVGDTPLRLHPDFAALSWERIERKSYLAFERMLRPDTVVFDIGAHIGTYTIIAQRKTAPRGVVVAYEPCDATRGYLERHLAWNGAKQRVLVRPVCCGAEEGQVDYYYAAGSAEGANGVVKVDGFASARMPLVTIDGEVQRLGMVPGVLKIDVEGGEWGVLRGAERTLRAHRPELLLSLHPHALASIGTSPDSILQWLRALGYVTDLIEVDHEIHVLARPRA